jgi:hypothetical protein
MLDLRVLAPAPSSMRFLSNFTAGALTNVTSNAEQSFHRNIRAVNLFFAL